jgi:hypothetical protein
MKNQHRYTRKSLWLYLPLWLFFVYLFVQIFHFQVTDIQNIVIAGLYFVEFGVHEASHLVFAFLPSIFVAAAGSFGEIAFTVLIGIAAIKARAYFAIVFAGLWVMLAMNSVGRYMADARTQIIPLMSAGPEPIHDWHFVFNALGWLPYDTLIGGFVRGLGDVIGLVAIVFGLWMIITMFTAKNNNPATLKK